MPLNPLTPGPFLRLFLSRLSLLVVIGAPFFPPAAARAAQASGSFSRPVVCASLLKTGAALPHGNPLASLRDIQYRLKLGRKFPTQKAAEAAKAYSPKTTDFRLDQIGKGGRSQADLEATLSRLGQLEFDSTRLHEQGLSIGYEFRGASQISAARELMSELLVVNEGEVRSTLKKRYPFWRPAGLFQHSLTAFFLGISIVPIIYGELGVASFVLPGHLALAGLNEWGGRLLNERELFQDFSRQFEQIDQSLTGSALPYFSLVSGSVRVNWRLHNLLMDMDGRVDDLKFGSEEHRMMTDAVERIALYFMEFNIAERGYMEELRSQPLHIQIRGLLELVVLLDVRPPLGHYLFYDSIFYVDEETGEPVWLMYYRSFKNRPVPPKKPKKQKEAEEAPTPVWQGELQPTLVPVRR